MGNERPAWVKDVKVFVSFTLLDAALVFFGVVCELQLRSEPVWLWCWYWVFAAPARAAGAAHCPQVLAWPILLANPLLYGLVWWGIWRAMKLFRTKPTD